MTAAGAVGDGRVPDATRPVADRPRVDPVVVEVVAGSLASIEAEVETAIARTARSPMIRDAHDFRVGIHDRRLRKLTGRSYSALVHPVVRDHPLETMRPGDVFFHNDVYLSEGGIGHLPDLCVTVPVFCDGAVVAFVQAFGHHDDIGGVVPGSMPSHARSVFEEGLMVPPIRLWDEGRPNTAALAIMARNSRMPESLAADLDAECSASLMGARRLGELFDRYGRAAVEACFDAIIERTTETFRREILAKISIRLWDEGRPNTAALAIMARNSRMPESLAADLDAECSASLMGARRLGELFDRYGRAAVEACFDAIIERTTETFRREILAKIPIGSWVWEDYAEQDGVDPPRLHSERITVTRTGPDDPGGERLILD